MRKHTDTPLRLDELIGMKPIIIEHQHTEFKGVKSDSMGLLLVTSTEGSTEGKNGTDLYSDIEDHARKINENSWAWYVRATPSDSHDPKHSYTVSGLGTETARTQDGEYVETLVAFCIDNQNF